MALESGGGTFDSTTNTYTAPATVGTASIALTDSLSVTTHTTITINPPLSIDPTSLTMTVSSGQKYALSGLGGGAGYRYSVLSGSGTVDASGLYTAGTVTGDDVVQVQDAQGQTATARVHLVRAPTNGPVNTFVADANGTYLGGSFTTVYPYVTSHIASLDFNSGTPNLTCDLGTGFDAPVRAIAVVENAVYIGGDFANYKGQSAQGLVKLDARTCALDTTFTQSVGFSGAVAPSPGIPTIPSVYALASDGSSLYVGGNFSSYRGLPAGGLAKLDLTTGGLDQTFTQAVGVDGAITVLGAANGAVFVGGTYFHYRNAEVGLPNGLLQKLDAVTGNLDPTFAPHVQSGGVPLSLAFSGSSVYLAGNFSPGVEKLDLTTGAADPQFAQGFGNAQGQINSIALAGGSLFLAGSFSSIGGTPAQNIAKIDAATGKGDPAFNRASAADAIIWNLAVAGTNVYIVGDLNNYAGHRTPHFAKLDSSTGALDSAFGLAQGFGGAEPTVVAASTGSLLVGGGILTYGGTPVPYLVKLDPVTGVVDSTFAQAGGPDGAVTKLLLAGSSLYVAGHFANFGPVPAALLAKVDTQTGTASAPFSAGAGFDLTLDQQAFQIGPSIAALALSGNSLYVGGFFTSYRGQPVTALAKLDTTTGALDTNFNQATGFTGSALSGYDPMGVTALTLTPTALYVGGNFTGYRSVPQYLLAKLDPVSGALDPQFAPINTVQVFVPSSPVGFNVLLVSGTSLYAGGAAITLAGGQMVNGLTKLDALTGNPDPAFVPGLVANTASVARVYDLALSGSSLYVAGDFAHYLGTGLNYANNLVKLDAATGALDSSFTQPSGPDQPVNSLWLGSGQLVINGSFDSYRGDFAAFSTPLDPITGAR
jgi:hypothetical protein